MKGQIRYIYKGFLISRFVANEAAKPRKVVYSIPQVNFYLPRSFLWKGDSAVDLHEYIDALVDRRQLVASKYEEREIAYDMEYVDPPPERIIQLSPQLLMSVLRGEFPLEAAVGTKIRIRDPEATGRMVVTSLPIGAVDVDLLDLYKQSIMECAQAGRGLWLEERIKVLKEQQSSVDAQRMDFNLVLAEEHGVETETVDPLAEVAEQAVEEPVSTTKVGENTQVITVILAAHPYFVKRLFDPAGNVIRTATAWAAEGPWVAV